MFTETVTFLTIFSLALSHCHVKGSYVPVCNVLPNLLLSEARGSSSRRSWTCPTLRQSSSRRLPWALTTWRPLSSAGAKLPTYSRLRVGTAARYDFRLVLCPCVLINVLRQTLVALIQGTHSPLDPRPAHTLTSVSPPTTYSPPQSHLSPRLSPFECTTEIEEFICEHIAVDLWGEKGTRVQ